MRSPLNTHSAPLASPLLASPAWFHTLILPSSCFLSAASAAPPNTVDPTVANATAAIAAFRPKLFIVQAPFDVFPGTVRPGELRCGASGQPRATRFAAAARMRPSAEGTNEE